ncbi:hypothetical protein NQ317_016449 [Molorchus minor]|uniref:C2H2-type domain-containing protein n=1 Tax=Molorchus minor TaxID=1323400 RepID=A0ABQ9K1W4_9CUCU|nr:hypothetical protein NQ317_016449 [Molorchus minor]
MSYYKPSFSQTLAMSRGRGYSSSRGNSYRGSSTRGSSSWGGGQVHIHMVVRVVVGFHHFQVHFAQGVPLIQDISTLVHLQSVFDILMNINRIEGSSSRRSPERKRLRLEAPSSRHDSYGGYGPNRHEGQSSYSDRRSYSGGHSTSTPFSRRDEFRRPGPPPPRGAYRGRISSRGSRGIKLRDRPPRRRLVESSYAVRKRIIPTRTSDYVRRLKISRMRSRNRCSGIILSRGSQTLRALPSHRRALLLIELQKRKLSDKEDSGDERPKEKKSKEGDAKSTDGKELEDKSPKKEKVSEKDSKSESGDENRTHLIAMRKIALKQKSILAQMRQAQRNTQNELEKNSDDLASKTNFCPLCKLNYKQKKAVHQVSEAHKNMKKFLMPFCKICNITFKSPMIFESHLCSIEHIKRKQRMDSCGSDMSAEEDSLENFTTIDSVGDGDGSDDEKKEEAKEPINVGIEQIRKIEAHYCDLCKMYLPRGEEIDIPKILSKHCKLRVHMQRYVRYKEDQDLEKRAEKLQRKEIAEKEEANEHDVTKSADDDEARDDKLWADVDKDLGDILAEAESGNKSSDEDDDSHVNGERYDRFKLSEKKWRREAKGR